MNKLLALVLLMCAASPSARAAECTEIGTVNTTISSPGNYCLSANLSANATSGSFITIASGDVTLDCRGYSLHNSSVASTGNAYGISFNGLGNVQVRNCRIIGGFAAGIYAYQNNGNSNTNQNLSFVGNTVSGALWYGILAYGTTSKSAATASTTSAGATASPWASAWVRPRCRASRASTTWRTTSCPTSPRRPTTATASTPTIRPGASSPAIASSARCPGRRTTAGPSA
jgi:hypothetical protein